MTTRIGSLCTGYGGLDDAVQHTFGGELAWVADNDPGAAAILAHHYPRVPNLGDITAVNWADVPPIDVLTMGFPCQDVSVAGQRAGLLEGNRSGVWRHCARAIEALNPQLVVIENVPGLLSSRADGDVESCPWCLGDPGDEPPLRALGAVLADLAGLRFDAEWTSLDASAVGACHKRRRVFILAWPAHTEGTGLEDGRQGRPARDAANASDAQGVGRRERRPEPAWIEGRPSVVGGGSTPAAHTDSDTLREQPVPIAERCGTAFAGLTAAEPSADPASVGHGNPGPASKRGMAAPAVTDRPAAPADPADLGLQRGGQHGDGGPDLRTAINAVTAADADSEPRNERRDAAPGEAPQGGAPAVDCGCDRAPWGRYAPAIHRWEQVMGRPAPAPVDERGRLAVPFVEWMQGCNEGHVTAVPGLSRKAMLKALGNGVISVQAAAALPQLAVRAGALS